MAEQVDGNGEAPLVPPRAQAASATAVDETPIFHGSVSLWMGVKAFAFSILVILLSIGAAVYGAINSASSFGTPLMIGGIALFVATALMLAWTVLSIRCLRYKITRRLIEREQGVIFKRIDALDLGRIKDVQLSQSLLQRMVNIGTIEVFSSDKTDPVMLVEAIPGPRPVYEQLRDAVIEISQRRGIVPMG